MSKTHNYVYKITNKVNGKIYIGVHCTDDLDDGYMGSGTAIIAARNKYGEENFTKEILVDYDSSEVAYRLEKMLVNEKFVKRNDTYNLREGGIPSSFGGAPKNNVPWNKGKVMSDEYRETCSKAATGRTSHRKG